MPYSEKLCLRNKTAMKTFRQKLWEFIATRPALQEILREFFKLKQKGIRQQHEST